MDAKSVPTASSTHSSHPIPPQTLLVPQRDVLHADNDGRAPKRIKTSPEEPALYSENVRRKLAATTRTGQACDRCKERKMKCDPDPIACHPCRQKSLKCYTTDRVSGQSRERGQSDRAEGEVSLLRDQLAYYQRRYGPVTADVSSTPYPATSQTATAERHAAGPLPRSHLESQPNPEVNLPGPHYVGWPLPKQHGTIHKGPVEGTKADILDWGIMDSGTFDCDTMHEPLNDDIDFFNFSTSSVLKSINQRQRVTDHDLHLPSKAEALHMAEKFLLVMWGFVPVVHQSSFIDIVHRLYDPEQQISLAEKIQLVLVLGLLNHQTAIRISAKADKINDSYRYLHYALGHFPDLMKDGSLAAMQALALILVQFRNMPKPGYTWNLAQGMLIRCIDLDYHRDPDQIDIPPEQRNVLAKELRKRIFHAILGICVTTGCRLGRPAPWQFVQWDVPLPMAVLDSEISVEGVQDELSGRCDFWQQIHLAKLLPLYTELHNYILAVRRSPSDYLRIVEALQSKIDAWRADWDACTIQEDKINAYFIVSTLLIDSWAAEFILNLHHPSVCTARTPDIIEKNLETCHKAAKRLLSNFHVLSKKYKSADFTWHSVVAYTLAFGLTLHIYRRRAGAMTQEQFNVMKNELAGWMSLMAYADLVLRTDNLFQKRFLILVEQVQREIQEHISPAGNAHGKLGRASIGGVNGQQSRSGSIAKQENSPYLPPELRLSQDVPSEPNVHFNHLATQHTQSARYPGHPKYSMEPTSTASSSYPVYDAPVLAFPNLPTSLAPLLNETPPHATTQYQHPALSVQDPAMMFSPHLYTDTTAVWPLIPEGFEG